MENHAKKNNLQEEERLRSKLNAYGLHQKNCERIISIEQRVLVTRLHRRLKTVNYLEQVDSRVSLVRRKSEPLTSLDVDDEIQNRLGKEYSIYSGKNGRFSTQYKPLTDLPKGNLKLKFRSAESSPAVYRKRLVTPSLKNRIDIENELRPNPTSQQRYTSAENVRINEPKHTLLDRRKSDSSALPGLNERSNYVTLFRSPRSSRRRDVLREETR